VARSSPAGYRRFFFLPARAAALESPSVNPPHNFSEFWPFYVLAHRHSATRVFHSVGTLLGWTVFIAAFALRDYWLLLLALVAPYALAWFSHFFVEHNRPATFGHPLWSWLADQKMVAMVLAGRMSREVARCSELMGGSSAS